MQTYNFFMNDVTQINLLCLLSDKNDYFCIMESIRQQKVARLIQKELSEIFQHDGMTLSGGALITITTVRVTSDLSIARVYISIFGASDRKLVIENLKKSTKEIRYKLGQKVKMQLRIVPEIKFLEDDTLDFIERIDDLLKQ